MCLLVLGGEGESRELRGRDGEKVCKCGVEKVWKEVGEKVSVKSASATSLKVRRKQGPQAFHGLQQRHETDRQTGRQAGIVEPQTHATATKLAAHGGVRTP